MVKMDPLLEKRVSIDIDNDKSNTKQSCGFKVPLKMLRQLSLDSRRTPTEPLNV